MEQSRSIDFRLGTLLTAQSMLIIAGAGVLEVLAGQAIGKVEVKLLSGGFGLWGGFDLQDHGQHFPFGDKGVLHEPFAPNWRTEMRNVSHADRKNSGS